VTQVETESPIEFRLLADAWDEPARRREAALGSALVHALLLLGLVLAPRFLPPPRRTPAQQPGKHVTLLYPPLEQLTQTAPNQGPRAKLFLGENRRPVAPKLFVPKNVPKPSKLPGKPEIEQPKTDLARVEPPQLVPRPEAAGTSPLTQPLPAIAPPPAPPPAPKLTLENVSPGGHTGAAQPGVLIPRPPGNVVEGAVRDLSHGAGRGGTIVGDGFPSGLPDGSMNPSPGSTGSNLELLSDPMGVDFRPYLTRILAMVRRNWFAVIPESARLGMLRGRVALQFIVIRQGGVSKLVIADSSGYEALDRAAVAGISASNPFPPLPPEFRGSEVKLQFTFLYNLSARN